MNFILSLQVDVKTKMLHYRVCICVAPWGALSKDCINFTNRPYIQIYGNHLEMYSKFILPN